MSWWSPSTLHPKTASLASSSPRLWHTAGFAASFLAAVSETGFPAWSNAVSAQGSVKETLGSVNTPVVVGGQLIHPGDVVVADDDGVVCVPRLSVGATIEASAAREQKEAASREAFQQGQLGLDRYALRPKLDELGLTYHPYDPQQDTK